MIMLFNPPVSEIRGIIFPSFMEICCEIDFAALRDPVKAIRSIFWVLIISDPTSFLPNTRKRAFSGTPHSKNNS